MKTIKEAVRELKRDLDAARTPDKRNLAWRFKNGVLEYSVSARPQLPAALMLLEGEGGGSIYSLIAPTGDWLEKIPATNISTWKGVRSGAVDGLAREVARLEGQIVSDTAIAQRFQKVNSAAKRQELVDKENRKNEKLRETIGNVKASAAPTIQQYNEAVVSSVAEKPFVKPKELLAFRGEVKNVVRSGKLYEAAAGWLGNKLPNRESREDRPRSLMHKSNQGVLKPDDIDSRLLRYYMLATYALASHSRRHHPIAAMLVDTHGNILSSGVNSGWWRHAETSMMFNYFLDNPHASMIPPRSIIFSTLCPCEMCTEYMRAWNTSDQPAVIFFGQFDPGPSGSAGDSNPRTVQLAEVMKEPTVIAEDQDLKGAYVYTSTVHKARVEYGLQESCKGDGGNIAERLRASTQAETLFLLAQKKLTETKLGKTRSQNDPTAQQKLEVLEYLKNFLAEAKRVG